MSVTETILRKRLGLPFCVLGDLSSSPPGINAYRNDFYPSGQNFEFGLSYPATTPDNIMRKVKGYGGAANCPGPPPRLVARGIGGVMSNACSTGFPPSPIPGSPFYSDDRYTVYTGAMYPRWTAETGYSWDSTAGGQLFTPADFPSTSSAFDIYNCLTDSTNGKSIFMSVNTSPVGNDPTYGGDSTYTYQAFIGIYMDCAGASCWNNGATLELNFSFYKTDIALTYVPGTFGAHSFTYGSAAYDQTVTQSVTIDASMCTGSEVLVTTLVIPSTTDYVTYLDDFFISSVTAP